MQQIDSNGTTNANETRTLRIRPLHKNHSPAAAFILTITRRGSFPHYTPHARAQSSMTTTIDNNFRSACVYYIPTLQLHSPEISTDTRSGLRSGKKATTKNTTGNNEITRFPRARKRTAWESSMAGLLQQRRHQTERDWDAFRHRATLFPVNARR